MVVGLWYDRAHNGTAGRHFLLRHLHHSPHRHPYKLSINSILILIFIINLILILIIAALIIIVKPTEEEVLPSSYLYSLINNRAKQFYQEKMKFSGLQWSQNEDDNENEDYVLEECFCDALGPTCTHLAVCGREEKVNHLGVVSIHTKV